MISTEINEMCLCTSSKIRTHLWLRVILTPHFLPLPQKSLIRSSHNVIRFNLFWNKQLKFNSSPCILLCCPDWKCFTTAATLIFALSYLFRSTEQHKRLTPEFQAKDSSQQGDKRVRPLLSCNPPGSWIVTPAENGEGIWSVLQSVLWPHWPFWFANVRQFRIMKHSRWDFTGRNLSQYTQVVFSLDVLVVNKKLLFYNLITLICNDFMNSKHNLVREVTLLHKKLLVFPVKVWTS